MGYIDSRSYYQNYEIWQHLKKSPKWLNGYKAGFCRGTLPSSATEDFKEGHRFGAGYQQREKNPLHIKGGFSYGHGFGPDPRD